MLELPGTRAPLARAGPVGLPVVDGSVALAPQGRPGLGAHVHPALSIPVIGGAKTSFNPAIHAVEVRRGEAGKPLYVTAAGLPLADAAQLVRSMAGPYPLPHALRRVDHLARGRANP